MKRLWRRKLGLRTSLGRPLPGAGQK